MPQSDIFSGIDAETVSAVSISLQLLQQEISCYAL